MSTQKLTEKDLPSWVKDKNGYYEVYGMDNGKMERLEVYAPYTVKVIDVSGKVAHTMKTSRNMVAMAMIKGILNHYQSWIEINGLTLTDEQTGSSNVFKGYIGDNYNKDKIEIVI